MIDLPRRVPPLALAAVLAVGLVSGCDAGFTPSSDDAAGGSPSGSGDASGPDAPGSAKPDAEPATPAAAMASSIAKGTSGVAVDTALTLDAEDGTFTAVSVTGSGEAGQLVGELSSDGTTWSSTGRLEPGATYAVKADLVDAAGDAVVRRTGFSTQDLSLDDQTFASVAPLAGETVGVGMPVVVSFDVAVTDRASIEKHLSVQTTPEQPGTWRWVSDTEVHYRPKAYWQPGTQVSVDVDINSIPAGNGVYGQESRRIDFKVGDRHVYKVNAETHQMQVFSGDTLLRTIPITTGKEGFTTRSGTKVIMEKFASRRMNSETVGIPAGSADAYDIDDVQWAMRLTYSGEFLHAAPWSVGSQGVANVSHGCTGMSTANAKFLYDLSRRGDVVVYTGTDRPMTLDNGYGDWNESFTEAKKSSAL